MRGKEGDIVEERFPGWDHPRTCGEKWLVLHGCGLWQGSPPHMRGKGLSQRAHEQIRGITPAHAGKRNLHIPDFRSQPDHPRTCGEKDYHVHSGDFKTGSPPHMRGKAAPTVPATFPTGITPAHAGKRLKRSRSTVPHAAIVPLFPSVCNKPAGSDGSPAGHDAPPFLPIENTAPASPAYNLRSL